MTGGATFAHTLTTIYDDHDDSQNWDRHVHLACGLFISYRCVSEALGVSTNRAPDCSDLSATLHVNASCSRGSVEVVEEIVDVYIKKNMPRMSCHN